jgi:hypothetical protein
MSTVWAELFAYLVQSNLSPELWRALLPNPKRVPMSALFQKNKKKPETCLIVVIDMKLEQFVGYIVCIIPGGSVHCALHKLRKAGQLVHNRTAGSTGTV